MPRYTVPKQAPERHYFTTIGLTQRKKDYRLLRIGAAIWHAEMRERSSAQMLRHCAMINGTACIAEPPAKKKRTAGAAGKKG
jgi:hypothetical protein